MKQSLNAHKKVSHQIANHSSDDQVVKMRGLPPNVQWLALRLNNLVQKLVSSSNVTIHNLNVTTRYNDMTKGACGCGSEPNPPDFWTKSKFTAAGNAMMVGIAYDDDGQVLILLKQD